MKFLDAIDTKIANFMSGLQEKYDQILAQNESLRKENAELISLFCAHGIEYKPKYKEVKYSVYSPISFSATYVPLPCVVYGVADSLCVPP